MTRTVYYTIHCSSEENQTGTFHYSEPYTLKELAVKNAKLIKDDFVTVEKHDEILQDYDWLPQWEKTNWNETIEF